MTMKPSKLDRLLLALEGKGRKLRDRSKVVRMWFLIDHVAPFRWGSRGMVQTQGGRGATRGPHSVRT